MKGLIIILALVFLTQLNIFGQHEVEYNYKSKKMLPITPADHGSISTFRISNINKFLYQVKISSSQSDFISKPPVVFSSIFVLEKKEQTLLKETAQKAIQNIQKDNKDKETAVELMNNMAELLRTQMNLNSYYAEISLLEIQQPDTISTKADSLNKIKIEQLNKEIEMLNKKIKELDGIILKLTKALDNEFSKKTVDIFSKGLFVSEAFDQLEDCKTVKNKLIRIAMTDGLDFNQAIDNLNEVYKEYPNLNKPEKLLSAFEKSYRQFNTSLQLYSIDPVVVMQNEDEASSTYESIKALGAEIEEIKKRVDKTEYEKLFNEINELHSALRNINNYFIVSDPIQAKKDIINYEVKIEPKKGLETLTALEDRNFSIEVPIRGGVKIDFSSGLCFTSNLYDRKYSSSVSQEDTTLSNIKEHKDNNIGKFSLGAFLHVSLRSTYSIKPGFTFGLGLNSEDLSNMQVYIGGSIIIGQNERFIVSSGISFAYVDYLKGQYSLKAPTKTIDIEDTLTEKSILAGWFVSFSYNLTNSKED